MSILNVFYRTADGNANEIDKLYDEGDIENYTIKVHALKSTSRAIGAESLGTLADVTA